ncbi:uncharacterized protein C8orf48 homolog isoform X4 [Neopelma chrysocephalum]|uniref:uncharacterized protein C8orf48 homolog isoform X4 n=1 Tax=Neopelma chrysocephalum TaxID=114329 RepID=UPI000FCD3D3A|nr:uncharacterized protein C8orf48 homolog isoform X4 [Neopelma chrysocephalum]
MRCELSCDSPPYVPCAVSNPVPLSVKFNLFAVVFFLQCCPVGTVPSDSSGSHEKERMELSQSYNSSALDYSEDTFESFSEEEEIKPSGSCCPTEDLEGSDVLESTSWLAGQSHAEEQSGVDSAALERVAIGKWIDAMGRWRDLKNKEAEVKQDNSVRKTHGEIPELFDGELDALRSFCTRKINGMNQQLSPEQANTGKARKLQDGVPAGKTGTRDGNCIVPGRLMNRILLENTRETVKQVTEAQIHEASSCPDCQKKEAELARIAFVRQKKALMEGALIQEKLEEQIYSRDMLTLLGEALRSFPKPSEDPRALWQRLKGQKIYQIPVGKIKYEGSKVIRQLVLDWTAQEGAGMSFVTPFLHQFRYVDFQNQNRNAFKILNLQSSACAPAAFWGRSCLYGEIPSKQCVRTLLVALLQL